MDNKVTHDASKCIKPTLPFLSALPSGMHSPIEVEEDKDNEEDKQLMQLKTPPAVPESGMHSPIKVETVGEDEDEDELIELIGSKPSIKVQAARKGSSRDNESDEQRNKRREKDRLNKQKRRREKGCKEQRTADKLRKKSSRADASDEASNLRRTADNERKIADRANASEEASNLRRIADNGRKIADRANASEEASNLRRIADNGRKIADRANASEEASNLRRTARNEQTRLDRANASVAASNERRRTEDNVRKRLVRGTETPGDFARRQEANNESQRAAREQVQDTVRSKVVDFSTLETGPDSNFQAFEQNPEVAAMLWHVNSGFNQFNGVENLTEDDPQLKQKVVEEILAQKLSNEEKDALINDYLHAMGRGGYNGEKFGLPLHCPHRSGGPKEGRDAPILTCGSCGVKEVERGRTQFFEISLDLLDVLTLSELQLQKLDDLRELPHLKIAVDDIGTTKDVDLSKLPSVYIREDGCTILNLHPEFVHKDDGQNECTFLCLQCKTSAVDGEKIPSRSIASGVDFGDYHRIGLTTPNAYEVAMLARIRHYHNVVKIQPNGGASSRADYSRSRIKGHSILFEHDAPQLANLALMFQNETNEAIKESLSDYITLHFVGPENELDKLAMDTFGSSAISARAFVIHQWLSVLQRVNKYYKDDAPVPTLESLQVVMEECNKNIVASAIRISDRASLNTEQLIGDDVARVRTQEQVQGRGESSTSHHASQAHTQSGSEEDAFTYSSVGKKHKKPAPNTDDSSIPGDDNEAEHKTDTTDFLEQAAEAFGFNVDHQDWKSQRQKDPMNEFTNFSFCLAGAFPHVFMFGESYDVQEDRQNSALYKQEIRHLLLQYSGIPGTCRELIFYLFDQAQRFSNIRGMAAKVKGNPHRPSKTMQPWSILKSSRQSSKMPSRIQQAKQPKRSYLKLFLFWMLLVAKLSAVPLNIMNQLQRLRPCHNDMSLGLYF